LILQVKIATRPRGPVKQKMQISEKNYIQNQADTVKSLRNQPSRFGAITGFALISGIAVVTATLLPA